MYKVPEESLAAARAEIARLEQEIKALNGIDSLPTFPEKWTLLVEAFHQDKQFMAALAKECFPESTEVFPKDSYVLVFFGNYKLSLSTNPRIKTMTISYVGRFFHEAPTPLSEKKDAWKRIQEEQKMADLMAKGDKGAIMKFLWPSLGYFARKARYAEAKRLYPNKFNAAYWQDSVDKQKKMYEEIYQEKLVKWEQFKADEEAFGPVLQHIKDIFDGSEYKLVSDPAKIMKRGAKK